VSAHYCLACARDGAPGCPMTAPVVKGILDGLRPDDFGLTVTTLLACSRKEQLKQGWPYHLRPSESWCAYRGQLLCKTLGWYDSVTVRKYCFNNTSHHIIERLSKIVWGRHYVRPLLIIVYWYSHYRLFLSCASDYEGKKGEDNANLKASIKHCGKSSEAITYSSAG